MEVFHLLCTYGCNAFGSMFILLQIMIHSLFLINTSGDVFLEKHWKSVISRSVVDYFFEAQNKAANSQDIPPVIATPHHYLISIFRFKARI